MTQSGGAQNTVFSVTLYTFQKSGKAMALPAPPPPQSLSMCLLAMLVNLAHLMGQDCLYF